MYGNAHIHTYMYVSMQIMDFDVLPHFCKLESKQSGSSSRGSSTGGNSGCYSSSHSFHVELWNYIKQQSYASSKCAGPAQQNSFHVEVPEPDEEAHQIEVVLESTLAKLADENGSVVNGISDLHVGDNC